MELQSIKQRFDIIGDDPGLNRALDIAAQVAGTDLSVLVTGESGVGKEAIPQIIHQNSQHYLVQAGIHKQKGQQAARAMHLPSRRVVY